MYRNTKTYRTEKSILHDNTNTGNLYGNILYPDNLIFAGGYKRVLQGTVVDINNNPVHRARLLLPYVAGGTTIHTNNPWVFNVGDVLFEIGDTTEDINAENSGIESNTLQQFGTITAINSANTNLSYQITIATPAVGDTFSLLIGTNFDGRLISFTATTTVVADILAGLVAALGDRSGSHLSVLDNLEFVEDGTNLTITSKDPGQLFTVVPSVAGTTGAIGIAAATGMGEITITPDGGNGNQTIASKIGTIDQIPIGIVGSDYYLTDGEGEPKPQDIAPYNIANIRKDAIPYLDGQIVTRLNQINFKPLYGAA